MSTVLVSTIAVTIISCFLLFYFMIVLLNVFKRSKWLSARNVLLVTAHPDDECMFFGPALRGLVKSAENMYLLCLSVGDHYGYGKTRKIELLMSCKLLGIPASNVTIIKHSLMPDDPMRCWRKDIIASVVLKYVSALSVDTVVSFDFYGVSGHLNHISIFSGLRHLRSKKNVPNNCRFFLLESVNMLRKYSSILDVPLSYTVSCYAYVCSLYDLLMVHRAMNAHRSQMLWFRYLYVMFSRYMIINTLRELKPHQSSHNGSEVLLKQS